MKTVLFFIVVTVCILTSTFAFADFISNTRTSFNLVSMVGVGFCLLGLAKIGRKII